MALETHIFSDLYQRVWINQESPFDEYDGISYIKPFLGLPQGVIVRDEYHKIWDFIKSAYRVRASNTHLGVSGGLVITGQPGIGKTLFLAYALVKALKEHIPVSYCVSEGDIVIFNKDGCNKGRPRFQIPAPEHTLCLVDSGVNLTQPPDIVLASIDNYVVQAASPKPERWQEWCKQRLALKWVMDLWTKGEMENLVRLKDKYGTPRPPDPSHYTPLELFDIIGPSPRNCFHYKSTFIKTPEGIKATQPYGNPASLLCNTGVLGRVLKTGYCPPSDQVPQFHRFFFGKPIGENPQGDDPRFRYTVPTAFLESRLYDYVVTREARKQFRLLCALAPLPQALDLVYEPYIVSHMCEITESLPCYFIDNPDTPSFHLGPGLSLERLPVESGPTGMREYRDNTIYMPQSGGASFDAFVISEKKTRVTMVHFAVVQSHELEPSGICQVIDDLKGKLSDLESVQWSFLFVAPGNGGEMIAYPNMNFKLGEEYPEVRIGWISTDDEEY